MLFIIFIIIVLIYIVVNTNQDDVNSRNEGYKCNLNLKSLKFPQEICDCLVLLGPSLRKVRGRNLENKIIYTMCIFL